VGGRARRDGGRAAGAAAAAPHPRTVDFVVDGRPTPLSAGRLAVIPDGIPHSASIPPGGERVVTVNVWRLRKRPEGG
jgi:hypothetical protein